MNSDFKDLLAILLKHKVEFLIVGGYAAIEYAEPRFTKDLDIWVGHDLQNAKHIIAALKDFGAPLFGATEADFATPGNVLQLGMPPVRIDILTSIDGVEFIDAWLQRVEVDFEGVKVYIISLEHLIKNKESTSRPRDKEEAALLRTALKKRK